MLEVLDQRRPLVVGRRWDNLSQVWLPELEQIPQLDRRYSLLYLTSARGYLTRFEIDSLGDVLYEDAQQSRIRSLRAVAQEAGVLPYDSGRRRLADTHSLRHLVEVAADWWNGIDGSFGHDAFLNHVVPVYDSKEMEQTLGQVMSDPEVLSGRRSTGMIDLWAGFGHSRPLLFEMEIMGSTGLLVRKEGKSSDGKDEVFVPTIAGGTFAEDIHDVYEGYRWSPNVVIAMRPYSRDIHVS